MKEKRSIAVIGAGIAGLASALALKKKDFNVTVFEKSSSLRKGGNSIWLYPNALRILDSLGLTPQLERNSTHCKTMEYCDSSFERYLSLDLSDFKSKFQYPVLLVSREYLTQMLLEALGEGHLRFSSSLKDLSTSETIPVVHIDKHQGESFDAVIAADGIFSSVRSILSPRWKSRELGQVCWLGAADLNLGSAYAGRTIEAMGRGLRVVFVQAASKSVLWSAIASDRKRIGSKKDLDADYLRYRFREFADPMQRIFAASDFSRCERLSLRSVPQTEKWNYGAACLIGDAAHGMAPNLGQGAAQALEDAWVLSECLEGHTDAKTAMQEFYQLRRKKVASLMHASTLLGEIGGTKSPFVSTLRDTLLPYIPSALSLKSMNHVYAVNRKDG